MGRTAGAVGASGGKDGGVAPDYDDLDGDVEEPAPVDFDEPESLEGVDFDESGFEPFDESGFEVAESPFDSLPLVVDERLLPPRLSFL